MPATHPRPGDSKPAPALTDKDPIAIAKPSWRLIGDFYILYYWISSSQATEFPSMAYSALEASSQFADASSSRPVGGVGMIQIIRYSQSPVGPYDELAIIPGKFEWSRQTPDSKHVKSQDYKVSRIYVSQKHTCYNGRVNNMKANEDSISDWNIPKHLARFEWERNYDGSQTVKVFPHDMTTDDNETHSSSRPFFRATMKNIPFIPSFPFSTSWLKYVGIPTRAVHPQLPEGKGSQGELPGTDRWCIISPAIKGNDTALITIDMSQNEGEDEDGGDGGNFWPGLGRWHVGMKMKNAVMTLGPPDETW
ncbi:hypothetical protein XA68_11900 [Ophiocordyceps unilateralis]|uniref:Uncharacterized protein n=1 Tax=Ophiocordyceps unilateralis TaxID=268505 RepID=A0A2A9PEF4_OPHUN|nr:hypothetical protein XA68_11900 [Ophiocordyceps unilateralis]